MGISAKKKNEEGWGVKFSRVSKESLVEKVMLEQRLKGGSKGRSQESVWAELTAGTRWASQGRNL